MPALVLALVLAGALVAALTQAPAARAATPPTATAAAAATASQLTISPVIISVDASAGQTVVEQVGVRATGGPLVLDFEHADFGFARDTYQVRIIEDAAKSTTPFSTRGWFSAPPGPYRLRAGEERQVPVSIHVPAGTDPGEYLGVAFFRTVPDDAGAGTRVLTSARSGPLVFVTVGGKGAAQRVSLGALDVPRFSAHGPVKATTHVVNRGGGHVTYSGTVTLRGPGGSKHVSTVPEKYSVPGIEREVAATLGGRHLRPGRYVTDVRLQVEPGGTTLHARATTWVVPAWLWIALGLLVLVAAALVALVARWALALRRRRAVAALDDEDADDLDDEFDANVGDTAEPPDDVDATEFDDEGVDDAELDALEDDDWVDDDEA